MPAEGTLPVAPVPSEDPKGKKKEEDKPASKPGKDAKEEETELSEEDIQLQNELDMLVERLKVRQYARNASC